MKKAFLLCQQLIFISCLFAQNGIDNAATFNPHELFAQSFNSPAGNPLRSAKGVPGPMYWQNNASYTIHAI